MRKLLTSTLALTMTTLFTIQSNADHGQMPNYDSATATLTVPSILRDADPNMQFSNVSLRLLAFDNLISTEADGSGVPAYQTIRVNLSPAQEVNEGVTTAGSCRGIARIVHTSRYLEAAVICDNVDAVGAHIHVAASGSNGGILYHMEIDSSVNAEGTVDGTLIQLSRHDCTARTNAGSAQAQGSCLNGGIQGRTQLSESEYADFMAGNFYFNVHTPTNPGGELRGQIIPNRILTSTVQCSQSETEVSRGTVVAETNAAGDDFATCNASVSIDLSTGVITAIMTPDFAPTINAAHIHQQPDAASLTGPVIVPLSDDGNGNYVAADGTVLTTEQLAGFVNGLWYFNIHTADNGPGSSRAQILPTLN